MNLLTRTEYLKKTKQEINQEHTKEEIGFLIKVCIEYLTTNKPFFSDKKTKRLTELSKRVIAKHLDIKRSYGHCFFNNQWIEDLPNDN